MIPIDPGEDIGRLVVYAATQPEYAPLIARVDQEGGTFTLWTLTLEERQAILDGARIGLRILTFGHPLQPIHLAIEGISDWPYEVAPDERS